jgi:hypothetical protein
VSGGRCWTKLTGAAEGLDLENVEHLSVRGQAGKQNPASLVELNVGNYLQSRAEIKRNRTGSWG